MTMDIKGNKTKDMRDTDNYHDIPTINVKRLIVALTLCGIVLMGAVILLP